MECYVTCFQVTACFFFGAKHATYNGDLPSENLILFVVSIYGRLYTLYMIADLLKLFGITNVSESVYEQKIS
ncbi:unnamed protein product, partial [Callosobruchus maculatus]